MFMFTTLSLNLSAETKKKSMVCESHRLNLREGETFSFGLKICKNTSAKKCQAVLSTA